MAYSCPCIDGIATSLYPPLRSSPRLRSSVETFDHLGLRVCLVHRLSFSAAAVRSSPYLCPAPPALGLAAASASPRFSRFLCLSPVLLCCAPLIPPSCDSRFAIEASTLPAPCVDSAHRYLLLASLRPRRSSPAYPRSLLSSSIWWVICLSS